MRIAILGRTSVLLSAAAHIADAGHSLSAVITCEPENYYDAKADDFKNFARDHNCEFAVFASLNTPEAVAFLNETKSDIAISVNWPTLIGAKARAEFKNGILNAHAGDLPRYRGNATPNWAILHGEVRVGLCIHQMAENLDSGDIWVRRFFELTDDTYIFDVYEWIGANVPDMFLEAINGIANQTLVPSPQDHDPRNSLRCYPRIPEDGNINWAADTKAIHRLIRASSRPFYGAYSYLEDRKVTIWRASPVTVAPFIAIPGQVCERDKHFPIVACNDGMLRLEDITIDEDITGKEALGIVSSSLRARLRPN